MIEDRETRVSTATLVVLLIGCLCSLSLTCGSALGFVPLPDGRAWEMVSPLDKNGGDIAGIGRDSGGGVAQASSDGEAITYAAESSFAEPTGAVGYGQYVSTRHGSEGWSTQSITTPAIAGTYGEAGTGAPYKAFSADLSLGLLLNGETGGEAPIENPPFPVPQGEPEAPEGYQNFYLRSSFDGNLRPLLTFTPKQPPRGFYMRLEGNSPDLRHIVVSSDSALTTGATVEEGLPNLFEWESGTWNAVNIPPESKSGETLPVAHLGSGYGESDTVSDDGQRVFWGYGTYNNEALYVREDKTKTVRMDVSQGGPVVSPSENTFTSFQTASSDGSVAFFTSRTPLTSDADTGPPCGVSCSRAGNDLYAFDVQTGALNDLSVDHHGDVNGAEVQGVLGASDDGTYVYFVAGGILAGTNTENRTPVAGAGNLYVWHEDRAAHVSGTTFVGTLSGDANDWSPEVLKRTTRVAPGGQMVFMSTASLTGYDNRDEISESPDDEVYLYNPEPARLSCVSCNPSGARPGGPSSIPAGTPFEHRANGGAVYQSRALSEDGTRVFFDSADSLVPQDTDHQTDVYEYENGRAYLISSGTSDEPSEFLDASASGNDVFFLTRQQLVRDDTDHLVDLYDARVNGGLPEPATMPPCEELDCRSAVPPAPLVGVGASATFIGAGNPSLPSKPVGKLKRKSKKTHKKRKARNHRKSRKAAIRAIRDMTRR